MAEFVGRAYDPRRRLLRAVWQEALAVDGALVLDGTMPKRTAAFYHESFLEGPKFSTCWGIMSYILVRERHVVTFSEQDENHMREAMNLAELAAGEDEVPIGALIVRDGVLLGQGYNRNIGSHDPTAHAEIVALREACAYTKNYRLPGATLYVTLEPCPMCFAAIVQARIQRLVFGARDLKGGYRLFLGEADLERMNHQVETAPGLLEGETGDRVSEFFREKRARGKRKWMKPKH